MRQQEEKDIDGLVISVQQLPGMRAVKLLHRLAKAIGPGLLKSLGDQNLSMKGLANLNLNLSGAADAAQLIFDRFSEQDLEALIRELFETATVKVDGNTRPFLQVFDDVFAGRTATVLKAVQFALGVNYKNFFGDLLAKAAALETAQSK